MNATMLPSGKTLAGAATATTGALVIAGAWSQSVLGDKLLPHSFCITASAPLLWLHSISDTLIAVAYVLIPWCILRYVRLRGDVPFGWVAWLFGAFIVACGTTHVFDVVTLWDPVYWYSGIAKAFTAIVSLATAWTLYRLTPQALSLPSLARMRSINAELESEIATRKRAESRLRSAQMQLQLHLEQTTAEAAELEAVLDRFFTGSPVGMAIIDPMTRIVRANPSIANVTRRPASQFEKGTLLCNVPEWPEEALQAIASVFQTGQPIQGLVSVSKSSTGDLHLRANYYPILFGSKHALVGIVLEDITQQAVALEEAHRANKAKDDFLARVSHELRSPLQIALSSAEVLRRTADLPENARRFVDRLSQAVSQQARMISDLLDLSRVLSGKLLFESAPVDPAIPLRAAIDAKSEMAAARGIGIEMEALADTAPVEGDPARLEQVFANIVDNAIRFSPQGGVVRISGRKAKGSYCVSISDQGPGMAAAEQQKLFEPFVQGSFQPKESRGLGLGLAIVRGIVDAHGGRVWVESDGPGRGSTFLVDLPLSAREALEQPAEEPPDLRGLKVLYVEDQVEIAEGMAAGLRAFGADTRVARSYDEARQALVGVDYEAVVSDLNLGVGPGGLELARLVRQTHAAQPPILIAVSAYGMRGDVQIAASAGFGVLLVKPVGILTLARELERAARTRRGASSGTASV